MLNKSFFIIIVILFHLSTVTTYSAHELIKRDTPAEQQNSYCQDGGSQSCCTFLAHRVASENNSRCGSIVLNNRSGHDITLDSVNLEDGRWITSDDYSGSNGVNITCYPRQILLDKQSETISSVTSHFLGGVSSYVSFIIDDNVPSNFTVSWKVPTAIASPEYDFRFSSNKYNVDKETTSFEDCIVFQITINKKSWILVPVLISVISFTILILISILCCRCCWRRKPKTGPEPGNISKEVPREVGQNKTKGPAVVHEDTKKNDIEKRDLEQSG